MWSSSQSVERDCSRCGVGGVQVVDASQPAVNEQLGLALVWALPGEPRQACRARGVEGGGRATHPTLPIRPGNSIRGVCTAPGVVAVGVLLILEGAGPGAGVEAGC